MKTDLSPWLSRALPPEPTPAPLAPLAELDDAERDFLADALEFLGASAASFLTDDDLGAFAESPEAHRVASMVGEGAPEVDGRRVEVALVDFLERREAEARSAR